MYKLVLILRYLRRKIAPMFALLAVTLCTAMVIVVISVMGGFLTQMMDALHRLDGDITISSGLQGFEHYEELRAVLEKQPEIEATAAFVRSFGLITLEGNYTEGVEIIGIDPAQFNRVINYKDMLCWTGERAAKENLPQIGDELTDAGMMMQTPPKWEEVRDLPAMVPGIAVTNIRDRATNDYTLTYSQVGGSAVLVVMRATKSGAAPNPRQFAIVNEFKSGAYEIDKQRVYIPIGQLQELLLMDAGVDENDKPTLKRATDIVVRGRKEVPLDAMLEAVDRSLDDFLAAHPDTPRIDAQTWQQRHRTIIAAVSNEKGLITFLFVFISIVAFVMVATTFYNIVLEKTRDIGVLRALGASRGGVAGVFLGYGLGLGILGALLGFGLAAAIVINLNEIQEVIAATTGWRMWDPAIYVFDRIPGRLDAFEVISIMIGSVISSVLGSTIPALMAARVNPVEALRYE